MAKLYAGPAPPALMIPGLPNDIAMLCLLKVPRIYHSCLASVCITWRNAVCRSQFYQDRRLLGSTDAWLVLISAEILPTPILLYSVYDLRTRQLLFKVRFPPSLPAEGCSTYGKSVRHGGGAAVDPTCNISYLGDGYVAGASKYASLAVCEHVRGYCNGQCRAGGARQKIDAVVGKLSLNAADQGSFVQSTPSSGSRARGYNVYVTNPSLSRNAMGGMKYPNAASNDETVGSANLASCFVDTNLYSLDHYRIVAVNEYFAVLGFTQRSQFRAATCTFTIYNTVTDEWQHRWPLSICRDTFACGVIDGRLYVAGGRNEKGETERTTEVYDFESDEWGQMAETLPDGIGEIQGDVVYEGKLYVQCWEVGREERCAVWVYNPREDKWNMEQNGEDVGGKQLIATEKFMYAMGGEEQLIRYEASSGTWNSVGGERKRTAPAGHVRKRRTGLLYCNYQSQRAFGHGDSIFVLQKTNEALPYCGLSCDDATKCHRLMALPGWYHAGAVINT